MDANPGHSGGDPYWTLGPLFEQTRFRTTRQGYIPHFKSRKENPQKLRSS